MADDLPVAEDAKVGYLKLRPRQLLAVCLPLDLGAKQCVAPLQDFDAVEQPGDLLTGVH